MAQKFKTLTRNTIVCIIFWHLAIITTLFSQFIPVQFDQITTEHGLSNNQVNAILKDSKGFMWFGTADGLNRYDGNKFKIYKYDPDDSTSISGNYILSLCEDRKGNIWIGTNGDGLNRFDRNTGKFTRFDLRESNIDLEGQQEFNLIFSIYEDPYEQEIVLWLGSWGLTKFFADRVIGKQVSRSEKSVDTKFFKNYPQKKYGLCAESIMADEAHNLWLGSAIGLMKFNKTSETVTRCFKNKNIPGIDCVIRGIHKDGDGLLWLATEGDGLNKFDPNTGKYTSYKYNSSDPYSIGSNFVVDINEDDSGILWLLTSGSGYYRFDKKTERFFCYKEEPETYNRIAVAYYLGSAYLDNLGIHWLGSLNDGIFIYAPKKEKFKLYELSSDIKTEVDVRALYKDKMDTLWVSSFNALYKFDTNTGAMRKTKYDPKHANRLFCHSITVFYEDKEGILWLGTEGGGLKRYNSESKQISDFYNDSKLAPIETYVEWNNYIISLIEALDGNFWINSFNGFTYYFNRKNLQYEHGMTLSDVRNLYMNQSGNYFAGTWIKGFYQLENFNTIVWNYQHDPNDRNSLSDNRVNTIFEDKFNHLWIGSASGLNLVNREKHKFTHFTVKDGLASDNILSILEDDQGNLWLATPKAISRFTLNKSEPASQAQIKNYGISDDITLYAAGVCYKDDDGVIYFGGKNGFISFHPDRINENTHIAPIVITDFKLFNESVKPNTIRKSPLQSDISETDEIVLSHDQNFFSFEFAALDYTDPKKNLYAYRMRGIDKDWVYSDASQRIANYTGVQPGEYVFQVRGSNNDGVWNEEGTSIKIIIIPPWWQTSWAYSAYVLIIATVLIGSLRFEIQRRQRKIENKLIQEQELRKLEQANHRAVVAELQAKTAEAQKEKEKEQIRSRIASDLHDEIGSNLSSIALISQIIEEKSRLQKSMKLRLQETQRIALLTAESMRDIVWFINPTNDDMDKLIVKMRATVNLLLEQKDFTFKTPRKGITFQGDLNFRRNLFLIFKESLQNIIRHADATMVEIIFDHTDDIFIMHIRDNGNGFNVQKNYSGNGLKNFRSRAQEMGAKFEIKSEKGKGTEIVLSMKIP